LINSFSQHRTLLPSLKLFAPDGFAVLGKQGRERAVTLSDWLFLDMLNFNKGWVGIRRWGWQKFQKY